MSEFLLNRVESLDISHIIKKVAENNDWDTVQTKHATEWYIRHLFLCIKYPNMPIAAISKSADEIWHQHILDTRKYATDCSLIFGRFINHTPIYGEPTDFEIVAYNQTLRLYFEEFGAVPSDKGQTSGNYSYRNPNSEI